jgi:hypothetical protein
MFEKIYFFCCQLLKKYQTYDDYAENAFFLISLYQLINVLTIILISQYCFHIVFDKEHSIYLGIAVTLILVFVNRYYLYRRREIIFRKYNQLVSSSKNFWIVISWVYFIVTPSLFLFLFKYFKNK